MIVPDAIEPFVGWRAWMYWPIYQPGKTPTIVSLTRYNPCWRPGVPMVATCTYGGHEPPGAGCSCGVHALASPHDGRWPFGEYELLQWSISLVLIGRVALWGRVIEGEYGWRAQYAYPREFVVLERESWRPPYGGVNPWDHLREFGVPIKFAGTRDMKKALYALSLQEATPASVQPVAEAAGKLRIGERSFA
jgi:hypothetical protein